MTIAWFHEETLGDISLVGGKGANLGKMARAGLPVPPGFCVTTDAYKQFIHEMNLWTEIKYSLENLPAREAGENIRQMIEKAPMPGPIFQSIQSAYINLNSGHAPVAVRSSATAEDLAEASFAGQQESYLGIRGTDNLALHVQRCWASLWTERAIAYREQNQFPHEQVSLAVVVQEMVFSDVAGVLFTINPITNKRDEMLVNAAYGLGESVVSGYVTPDTYRIARKRFHLLEQVCGTKEIRIDMEPAGGGTLESRIAQADSPVTTRSPFWSLIMFLIISSWIKRLKVITVRHKTLNGRLWTSNCIFCKLVRSRQRPLPHQNHNLSAECSTLS